MGLFDGGGGGIVQGLGNVFSGNSKDAGAFGVGQFKGSNSVDTKAFEETAAERAQREALARQLEAINNAKAVQMQATKLKDANTVQGATIDQSQQAQFRNQQMGLAQQLQAQANGQGPSLAQSQLRQATDRNLAQAMAMGASARGVNPALAQRNIMNQTANINQQAGMQSADLRAQEQMRAQQQLAGVLDSGRGQDIGLATNQAGFNQQANLSNQAALNQFALEQAKYDQSANQANMEAALKFQQTQAAERQALNDQITKMAQNNRNAAMAAQELQVRAQQGTNQVNQAGYAAASQARGNVVGNIGQGIATAVMASDENLKTDVKESSSPIKDFLSTDFMKNFRKGLASEDDSGLFKSTDTGHAKMGKSLGVGIGQLFKSGPAPAPQSVSGPVPAAPSSPMQPVVGGLPAFETMSDENAKTGAKESPDKMRNFLDQLTAYSYQYKDPKFGVGTHYSPMAQDLEKTSVGKSAVVDTPEGKMVDYGKLSGVMLASQSVLNDRLGELEKALKMKHKKGAA